MKLDDRFFFIQYLPSVVLVNVPFVYSRKLNYRNWPPILCKNSNYCSKIVILVKILNFVEIFDQQF